MVDEASLVEAIARDAGRIAMQHFGGRGGLDIESKGRLDPVTQADRAVERLIVDRLRVAFPDDGIVGEEGASSISRSGRTWVIDPIDGTLNFIRGSDQWSVSIGLFDGIRPTLGVVYLPAQDKMVVGGVRMPPRVNGRQIAPLTTLSPTLGVVALGFGPAHLDAQHGELVTYVARDAGMAFRNNGCGSASLMSVAFGHVDGYISLGESSWDIMAAMAIVSELGAKSTVDWQKVGLHRKFPMACGTTQFLAVAEKFTAWV
jgi:myo-inositol-1(or 4)-monophosphatase